MNSDRWQRIQSLFGAALARESATRDDWLRAECGDDAELLREVRALLAHDTADSRTVERVILAAANQVVTAGNGGRPAALVGRRLGAWQLVLHLADGGMGAVYRAERADGQYEQAVAVKLISPALTSEHSRARLAAERQILARLNHPYIARLLDGGSTDDGVPYLVMDYVEGMPIDAWCNARGIDTRARLALFLKVCDAVDYAHRNLVVHRDLKPSNILVDAQGQPKLLDFGIAKLLEEAAPAITQAGERLLTPTHASPEQIRGEAITTAADVYALGVLLYELLAGRLPFETAGRTSSQVVHDVLQTDPPRPSTAAGTGSSGRIAAARRRGDGLTPERLRRELEGDLDTVVLTALRKEPERRYSSVQALADDIGRHLRHEPVSARIDTPGYRVAKFVRRHRAGVALSALAFVGVTAMTTFHTWRVTEERNVAQRERVQAQRIADYLVEVFRVTSPGEAGDAQITAREVLDRAALRLQARLDDDPRMRGRLAQALAEVYGGLGVTDQAQRWYEQALADFRASLAPDDPRIAQALIGLGTALRNANRFDAARGHIDEALATAGARRPPDALLTARALTARGFLHRDMGAFDSAETDCGEAIGLLRRAGVAEPEQDLILGVAIHCRAEALSRLDRLDEAERLFAEASDVLRRHLGGEHPAHVDLLEGWARVTFARGRYRDAAARLETLVQVEERLTGDDSTSVAQTLMNLGTTWRVAGDYAQAVQATERALAIFRRRFGEDHRAVALGYINLGIVRGAEGRFAEAEDLIRRALAIQRRILPADGDDVASTLHNLAWQLAEQGRQVEAVPLLEEAIKLQEAKLGPAHSRSISTLSMMGMYRLDSDPARGLAEIEQAVERARDAGVVDRFPGLLARQRLAVALRRRGELQRALELLDAVERGFIEHVGPRSGELHSTFRERAQIRIAQKDYPAAEVELRRAIDHEHRVYGGDTQRSGVDTVMLAEVKKARGELDAARELAQRGHEILSARLPQDDARLRHAARVLRSAQPQRQR
jgi:tetratricopeptide (TPR) repeat protein/tRNA A-37 threonylcarbamoyl transferase component Bud32